jgi:hypothetical protein
VERLDGDCGSEGRHGMMLNYGEFVQKYSWDGILTSNSS